jgi:hypothetical protein
MDLRVTQNILKMSKFRSIIDNWKDILFSAILGQSNQKTIKMVLLKFINRASINAMTLEVEPHSSSSFGKSFRYRAVSLWNNLDQDLTPSLTKFKDFLVIRILKSRSDNFINY